MASDLERSSRAARSTSSPSAPPFMRASRHSHGRRFSKHQRAWHNHEPHRDLRTPLHMTLDWVCKHHSQLSLQELYALLQLRNEVFVVEQKCPYQDIDGLDLVGETHHLLASREGRLLACLRLLDPKRHEGQVVIGRVVSSSAARGQGLGHQLMEQALLAAERLWPGMPLYLSAQAHLQGYYGRYGFTPVTEIYLEDDIPHIGMRRG
ncbi:Hypothetical protein A7982_06362 [Minicystis rosea]|nr:Hypothetical protein A7982_06362 [Minicystis rosea]